MSKGHKNSAWVASFQHLADLLAQDLDSETMLDGFLQIACDVSGADGALAFLPNSDGRWLCEAAVPAQMNAIGTEFRLSPERMEALEAGRCLALRDEDRCHAWTKALPGPTIVVPMVASGITAGTLVLWKRGSAEFSSRTAAPMEALAAQAATALDLLGTGAERNLALIEERARISRDLHDLAIQGLFATGMKLHALQAQLQAPEPLDRADASRQVAQALAGLEDSVSQIRAIVYRLREDRADDGLVDLLQREASTARRQLGFAPTLIIKVDNESIAARSRWASCSEDSRVPVQLARAANAAAERVSDDVVAVVREAFSNIARHARANSVNASVAIHGRGPSGEVVVSIIDDGVGMARGSKRASGLANMQRRAALRGGSFAVSKGPRDRGTSLVWRAPLA